MTKKTILFAITLFFLSGLFVWRIGFGWPGTGAGRKDPRLSTSKPGQHLKYARGNPHPAPALSKEDTTDIRPSGTRGNTDLKKTGPIPSQGASAAIPAGGTAVRRPVSRSEARRAALTRLMGHLPERYFTRQRQQKDDARAKKKTYAKWPEPGIKKDSAKKSASPLGDETASGKLLRFRDVPSQIRDAIPFYISILVHSKRSHHSWVNIDGEKVWEGEQMASGPKVEKITPSGVIFDYQGHRFYKGVRED